MRLLASIPLALLGSLLGSALRSVMKIAEARLDAAPDAPAEEVDVSINASLLATAAGGVTGLVFGSGTAFWTGVALGAAGIERFDVRLLRMAGVDVDGMIARAKAMAEKAQGTSSTAADEFTAASDVEGEIPVTETA